MKNAEDDRMDRIITSDDFTDIYNRMKEELSIAIEDLSKIQSNHTDKIKILNEILTLSENIYDSYIKASSIQKKKYIRMFFEGVYVDDRKIVRVEYNPVIADFTKIREVRLSDNWRGGMYSRCSRHMNTAGLLRDFDYDSLRLLTKGLFIKSTHAPLLPALLTTGLLALPGLRLAPS
jgi:hypothetical protein